MELLRRAWVSEAPPARRERRRKSRLAGGGPWHSTATRKGVLNHFSSCNPPSSVFYSKIRCHLKVLPRVVRASLIRYSYSWGHNSSIAEVIPHQSRI